MEELEVNHVAEIQDALAGMVGDRVKVKANMGRTRVIERMGVIKGVHPAVFIIEVDERRVGDRSNDGHCAQPGVRPVSRNRSCAGHHSPAGPVHAYHRARQDQSVLGGS